MIALLTWTTYGTWLPGPARGRIEREPTPFPIAVPEPDLVLSAARRRSLRWPPATLDPTARCVVLDDLERIAGLRGFGLLAAVAAADHVHVLLRVDADRPMPRLVQLVKGAASRALSVAAGDPAATTIAREPLTHHKWWARQHSFRPVPEREVDGVRAMLERHPDAAVRVYG